MKKKIISLCLVVVLALTAIGGATLAYFTDTDQKQNNFTIGNIDIRVEENDGYGCYVYDPTLKKIVEGAATPLYTNGVETGVEFKYLMPSYIIDKRPYVENTSDYPAYVRVAVTLNNAKQRNTAIDDAYESEGQEKVQEMYDYIFYGWGINNTKVYDGIEGYTNVIRNSMAQRTDSAVRALDSVRVPYVGADYQWEDWNAFQTEAELNDGTNNTSRDTDTYYQNAVKDNSNLYVFYLYLQPHEKYFLFNQADGGNDDGGLNIPEGFNNEQMEMFAGLEIGIYADAIQTVGFVDGENAKTDHTQTAWYKAFEVLNEEHPIGWWINTASQSE